MTQHSKETVMREPTLYDGSMGEWAKDLSLPIETD